MAGAVVQYRARVRPFARIEIRSRVVGRDAKFLYLEQHLLAGGKPAPSIRAGPGKIVATVGVRPRTAASAAVICSR